MKTNVNRREQNLIPDPQHKVIAIVLLLFACSLMAADFASLEQTLDGLVYHNIALQLAMGEGSFWNLPYFESDLIRFTDHPPLGIYLVSLWIDLFGGAPLSIKLFVFLIAGLLLLSLFYIARLANVESASAPSSQMWLALAVFTILPVTQATLPFLYLDNLVAVTSLLAVYCCLKARTHLAWAILFGLFVYIGVLTKGPFALFTLAAPLGLWWMDGRFQRAFVCGCIALLTATLLILVTLLPDPDAMEHMRVYFTSQILGSIIGQRSIDHTRIDQLGFLAMQVAVCALALLVAAKKLSFPAWSRLWLVLSLAGTLPLMISARQYDHYLLPALPYLALLTASLIGKYRDFHIPARLGHILGIIAVLWLSGSALYNWNSPGSHERDFVALAKIAEVVPSGQPIAFCREDRTLRIRAYLAAYQHRDLIRYQHGNPNSEELWLICTETDHRHAAIQLPRGITLWPPDA